MPVLYCSIFLYLETLSANKVNIFKVNAYKKVSNNKTDSYCLPQLRATRDVSGNG